MAAPSQTSPNQASQSTDAKSGDDGALKKAAEESTQVPSENAKDPSPEDEPGSPPTDSNAPAATATEAPSHELTYDGTEASEAYVLAKKLLSDGDFENALELTESAMVTTTSRLPENVEATLHESMAPLYYLYGTTLLYSIEESTDNLQTNAMAGGAPNEQGEEEADDSQIVWENLESARLILDNMLVSDKQHSDKLQLDLAQIHLRLGDLQRFNGRYQEAAGDYMACLKIRQPILGVFHRKVASVHHSLGLCYMLIAAEGDKQQEQAQMPVEEGAPPAPTPITPEQIEGSRSKAIEHFVACAKSFAGQIAFVCGSNPEEASADASDEGGGKTTGMDAEEIARYASSRTVRAIRARVAELDIPKEQAETIHDLKELLDELQETIDEVENAKKGMKEISAVKVQIAAQVAGEAAAAANPDGSTTSIGFGSGAAAAAAAASAPVGAAAAAPMMVVRKKKKRDKEDSKTPAEDDAKRAKTE